MDTQIQFNSQCGLQGVATGCSRDQQLCDVVKGTYNYGFADPRNFSVYQQFASQFNLLDMLGYNWNMWGLNNMYEIAGQRSLNSKTGEMVYQALMPQGFNTTNGNRIIEAPRAGTTNGDEYAYTTWVMNRGNEFDGEYFTFNEQIITMTNAGTTAATGDFIPANANRIVLPSDYVLFAAQLGECGACAPQCCGKGYLEIQIHKQGGPVETIWARLYPPDGVVAEGDFGKLPNNPDGSDGGWAFWFVRGMGKQPVPGATTIEPTDFGTANIICPGDEARIQGVIGVDKSNCMPCDSFFRKEVKSESFTNYVQKMSGTALCIDANEWDTFTYHQDPNRLNNDWIRALSKIHWRISNTLEWGQQAMGIGSDLSEPLHPGTGYESCAKVPRKTDGWFTLWQKHIQNKVTVSIKEGDCNNQCLVSILEEIIGARAPHLRGKNVAFVGDDFLVHLLQMQIANRVNSVATLEESMKIQQFVRNGSNVLAGGSNGQWRGFYPERLVPGSDSMLRYMPLMAGGQAIPFFKHIDSAMKNPGRLYLVDLDAIQVRQNHRHTDPMFHAHIPSAVPGTIIPTFEYDPSSYGFIHSLQGGARAMSYRDCPIKVNWHLNAGADYRGDAYDYSFIIDFQGIKADGSTVPIDQLSDCAGCYATNRDIYTAMRCDRSI